MNTRWVDKTPPRPFHPLAFGAAILVIIGIALIAFAPFAAANPPAPNPNDVSYWCPNGGVKFDPASTPFTVPPPSEGRTWTLLVLKAGDENSTPTPNETIVNPTPGTAYSRTDLKSISHVILCQSTVTTTTTPTTQGDDPPTTTSTTIATTTTAATTTTTRPPCVDCVPTQQTAPTTASTLPPGCIDCNIPPPPTTTVASTVTVPFTVATTLPPATTVSAPVAGAVVGVGVGVTTTAPTTLPVTGGSPWWLALFGVCLIALGGLAWAWTRT